MKDRFLKSIEFKRDSNNEPTGIVAFKRAMLTDSDGNADSAVDDREITADLSQLIKEPTWYEDPDTINA